MMASAAASSDARAAVPPTIDIPGLEGYYCPGPALPIWINRTDVRKVMAGMRCASSCPAHLTRIAFCTQALNVDPSSNFFSGDNGVGFNYTLTERSVFRVFEAAIAKGLKVLVYNGDTDPGVNMEAIQDIAAAFAQQYVTSFVHSLFVTSAQVQPHRNAGVAAVDCRRQAMDWRSRDRVRSRRLLLLDCERIRTHGA